MEFKVASVKVFNQVNRETGDTLNETVFKLNNAKEGYDEIVFQFREGEELKNLLLGFFQSKLTFNDFGIAPSDLQKPRCKIDSIERLT